MVTFHDGDVAGVVAPYVSEGLALGEPVVVVATLEHLAALDEALVGLGWDPDALRADDRLRTLDAGEALASFHVDGAFDTEALRACFVSLLDGVRGGSSRVRIFCEMVALLWERGEVAAVLALEAWWNEQAAQQSFTLLCGYPHSVLGEHSLADVGRVCELHSEVLPPPSYHLHGPEVGEEPPVDESSWAFLPVPQAIPVLRRFVTATLRSWGEEALVPDAALVTSEMATNAVSHADSPFHASIVRAAGVVRIAIVDSGPGAAAQRTAAEDDLSGRGIVIVDAVADRWGHDVLHGGKVVWAEFLSTALRARSA
jgi:anti-sigma regulatory factor (Ser/Thr protein kinase)